MIYTSLTVSGSDLNKINFLFSKFDNLSKRFSCPLSRWYLTIKIIYNHHNSQMCTADIVGDEEAQIETLAIVFIATLLPSLCGVL